MSNEKDLKVNLIKPIIFEDREETEEKQADVKSEELIKPIIFEEEKKGPEERYYLLLYYFIDDDGDESKTFEFIKGRTSVRERIIADLAVGDIDIHKSEILVEGAPLEDRISIYAFMKLIEIYFENDPFDIESYNTGDIDEETNEFDNEYYQINNNQTTDADNDLENISIMLGLDTSENLDDESNV